MNLSAREPEKQISLQSVSFQRNSTQKPDRSHFVGARACLDCHRSEFVSWLSMEHYHNSVDRYEITKETIAKRYLEKHGNLDRCYQCHSAPKEKQYGRQFVESGVSCESCHGAAGGQEGWLNRHAVYGPNITRLEEETPGHYEDRITFCEDAGMIRPGRQYLVAKNCLGCHIIGHPELINADIGHPISSDKYELLPALSGEVRHNFHFNQRHNSESPALDSMRRGLSSTERQRVYMILEQLARMEVAFGYLARLPSEAAFEDRYADDLIRVVEDAADYLDEYVEVLLDPDEKEVEPLEEETLEFLLDAVDEYARFDDLVQPTREEATRSAEVVRHSAAKFLADFGQGTKLEALDVFFGDFRDPVGEALQP